MRRTIRFLKGEKRDKNGVDKDHPFGYNEFLNYLARHNIPRLDDRLPPDASPNRDTFSHPIYSGLTFEWQEILHRTQYRAPAKLIGQGNFGSVYRCEFPEFRSVGAAKFQDLGNPNGHEEFMAEINALHNANHPNVIKLIGKSFGRKELVLVYQFMPRGSLDHHLLTNLNPAPGLAHDITDLDWEMRMRIAVGVAEALRYLHNDLRVIHRDVKLGNVLLDQDFAPKLTDFGLATKIVVTEDGNEIEREILPSKGTPGCVAPETEQSARVSTKSDVYSYGVFLYQLFTAKKACDATKPPEQRNLADWVRLNCRGTDRYLSAVMDVSLRGRYSILGLNSIFDVARLCTDPQASARPSMDLVVNLVRRSADYVVPVMTLRKNRSR